MYTYPQFMQSSDKFHFEGMSPLDSTSPQTEGTPFVPETTKIIIIPDYSLKPQLEENTEAILDLRKQVEILKIYKVGEKYSLYALNSLDSKKLQLEKSLSVVLRENPDGFIAELSDINLWGQGEIEQEAILNLCKDLEDLYFCLKKEQKNLGKEMQRQWKLLKEFIKEKRK